MKFLERLSLSIFSLIVLVLSVVVILICFNFVQPTILEIPFEYILAAETNKRVTIVVAAILGLLAIKCLFFAKTTSNDGKDGILLENGSGKLLISKETIENIIVGVARDVNGAENINSRLELDKNNNLKIFVTTVVSQNRPIKEVTTNLQDNIKEAIKRAADLEVKEVNVRIKNVSNKKSSEEKSVKKAVAKKKEEVKVENKEEIKVEEKKEEKPETKEKSKK